MITAGESAKPVLGIHIAVHSEHFSNGFQRSEFPPQHRKLGQSASLCRGISLFGFDAGSDCAGDHTVWAG